ncbi:esterase [Acrasis kona]|uniref:Esterase n=1 Tax=Acrasis kona TaxID=1008807 RepID=A0AAW2ZQC3_9EUKA
MFNLRFKSLTKVPFKTQIIRRVSQNVFFDKTKEEWRDFLQQRQSFGVLSHLGFDLIDVGENGQIKAKMEIKRHHMAANGYVHAACMVFLADTTCGFGCYTQLPTNKHNFTTIELKSNHIGTAKEGDTVYAESKVLHRGKSTHVWESTVYKLSEKDGSRKDLCLFRATQIILDPK